MTTCEYNLSHSGCLGTVPAIFLNCKKWLCVQILRLELQKINVFLCVAWLCFFLDLQGDRQKMDNVLLFLKVKLLLLIILMVLYFVLVRNTMLISAEICRTTAFF